MKIADRFKIQLFGVWCGALYALLLLLGWGLIAGFIPPHNPAANAEAIASIIRSDAMRIRIGMIFVMFAAMILIPFIGSICKVIARIEKDVDVLTYSALLGGAGTMILTFYPAIWWLLAAYRADRSPDLVYLLNDLSWLQLIGGISLFFALPGSLAVAVFCDDRAEPLPRWFGYFNLWMCVLILPDQLLFFFRTGPFAWNGIFGFWIPLLGFAGWFLVTFVVLRKTLLCEYVVDATAAVRGSRDAATT